MFSMLSQQSAHKYQTQRKAAAVKNNNSSIGFHLLSFGSDENMP